MTAPDAPFPTTAASSPAEFKAAYEAAFERGAEAIVSIHVAGTLSGTIKSAQIARDMLPDREIHLVDSQGASMAEGILCRMGVEMAADGRSAEDIAETLSARARDIIIYLTLDTLEYLKKGGRISGAQAAIGTLLSVKPIIEVKDGVVETADRVRTRGKARDRMVELATAAPDRADVDPAHDVARTSRRSARRCWRASRTSIRTTVSIELVGASVGPHLGPGCIGIVLLYQPGS